WPLMVKGSLNQRLQDRVRWKRRTKARYLGGTTTRRAKSSAGFLSATTLARPSICDITVERGARGVLLFGCEFVCADDLLRCTGACCFSFLFVSNFRKPPLASALCAARIPSTQRPQHAGA